MAQSLSRIVLHMVWSTKNRKPFITDPIAPKLYAYMGGILREWDCTLIAAGGMPDHVHLLSESSKNHSPAKLIKEIKSGSSTWIKTQGVGLREFYWQGGYGVFSVSASNIGRVTKYIDTQREHHAKRSFQDEFRALLRRHALEYDERYVWD